MASGSTQDQAPSELFAAYIQMTKKLDSERTRREQYIIFPQMPARLAPGDCPVTNHFVWFHRVQNSLSHRAVWKFNRDVGGGFKEGLSYRVKMLADDDWEISPMITCEVHPTELAAILKEPKTPYRIMKRLEKVARGMHGLDIS